MERSEHGSRAALDAMTSQQAVSYWLMPCPQAQTAFEELCKRASRGLRACTLPPHITLYSDRLDSEDNTIDHLRQVAEGRKPVLLSPRAIEAGPLFTRSLVVRFDASEELTHWCTQLRERSPQGLDYHLNPHLSLLYSAEPLAEKQTLARQLPLPAPALFNRVRAVVHPLTITTEADIAAVATLHDHTLA